MKNRIAKVARSTKETDIKAGINLDGKGRYKIKTGIAFFDHMLELFSKHSLIDIDIIAKGDLKVDYHHTVEDVGLVLGDAVNKALGNRKGILRYGWSIIPMDDASAFTAVDLGGRPYVKYAVKTPTRMIRDFDLQLIEEFFRAFAVQARMNLHVCNIYGKESHHIIEAIFKSLARSLRQAVARDQRSSGVPSSKGVI